MHNHYVSQFVIRRFSDAINIFDVHSGKIDESKRPHKVFYHEDIYDEETEKLFNFIESRVANIISQKILEKETIVLTRKELFLLKRYMLICSVRAQTPKELGKIFRDFEKNAEKYISIRNTLFSDCGQMPSIKSIDITDEELYARALKVFSKTNYIRDICLNPDATKEMLAWAAPFLESYIAFWDMPTDREYILTDCGMSSEYEGFHLLTGGLDISKASYLFAKSKKDPTAYVGLMASNCAMYENYDVFVLGSTRAMVMIHPFFRLYEGQKITFYDPALGSWKKKQLEIPDIWPAVIQNRSLFGTPSNQYIMDESHFFEEDRYIYCPRSLTEEDAVYINALLLSQARDIIGFKDPKKIIDSIYYYIWHQANYLSVKSLHDTAEEILNRLVNSAVRSPFQELYQFCGKKGGVNQTAFLLLFEKLTDNIYLDFRMNPYLNQYYLDNPQATIACHALDFLGEGEKRLDIFRQNLEQIQKERKETKNV